MALCLDDGMAIEAKPKQTNDAHEAAIKLDTAVKTRQKLESWLTAARAVNKDLDSVLTQIDAQTKAIEKLEAALADAVKHNKAGVSFNSVVAKFQNPMTDTIDGQLLLNLMPDLEKVPGLVTRAIEVDKKNYKSAVAAGIIPEAVDRRVCTRTPTTAAGKAIISYL